MPVSIFDDGTLFGDTDAIFGRVGSELIAAQAQRVRQTALRVSVVDEHLNDWEEVLDERTNKEASLAEWFYHPVNGHKLPTDIGYYGYRGGIYTIKVADGTIYRIRVGTPNSVNDRQIWIMTITDPTVANNWDDSHWSVLYSGNHYSARVALNDAGTGIKVIHSKSDGLYIDNVKKLDNSVVQAQLDDTAFILGSIGITDGAWYMGWIQAIYENPDDHKRAIAYYFMDDFESGNIYYDYTVNFGMFLTAFGAINVSTSGDLDNPDIRRFISEPYESSPRDGDHGVAQWYDKFPSVPDFVAGFDEWGTAPYIIRGVGGGSGRNRGSAGVTKMDDGFYYAFGFEVHQDQAWDQATSLGAGFPVWARSKDLKHWTDWTIGPPVKNAISGAIVQKDDVLYWCANQVIWKRPVGAITHDISNYVSEVNFELPRDNQPASGQIVVANPAGINDDLKVLSDREIVIEPGLLVAGGTYEYTQFERFFISQINTELQGKTNRLHVAFGNVWERLDNTLRDVTNWIGKTVWDDFSSGKRNQPFNYYFATDSKPKVDSGFRLNTKGRVLFTGWKGHNPDFQVHFSSVAGSDPLRVIFRYVDKDNFCWADFDAGQITVKEIYKGDIHSYSSTFAGDDPSPTLRIQIRWNHYNIWVNGHLSISSWRDMGLHNNMPGYVGFQTTGAYHISDLHLEDWQADLTMEDLARSALAMGDFHDVIVGNCDAKAFAIIWGPQTDLSTPATALAQVLETTKTQLIYRNGFVEIGRFNDQTVIKTIENEIIESDQIDEASRRINFASVDGNDQFWLEVDIDDLVARGRTLVGYFDLPELTDLDQIQERAREEIKRSAMSASPGGTTPLFFDVWRMDAINWVDQGVTKLVRVEGFKVNINQGTKPSQHQEFDLGEYSTSSDDLMGEAVTDA